MRSRVLRTRNAAGRFARVLPGCRQLAGVPFGFVLACGGDGGERVRVFHALLDRGHKGGLHQRPHAGTSMPLQGPVHPISLNGQRAEPVALRRQLLYAWRHA